MDRPAGPDIPRSTGAQSWTSDRQAAKPPGDAPSNCPPFHVTDGSVVPVAPVSTRPSKVNGVLPTATTRNRSAINTPSPCDPSAAPVLVTLTSRRPSPGPGGTTTYSTFPVSACCSKKSPGSWPTNATTAGLNRTANRVPKAGWTIASARTSSVASSPTIRRSRSDTLFGAAAACSGVNRAVRFTPSVVTLPPPHDRRSHPNPASAAVRIACAAVGDRDVDFIM